MVGFLPSVMMVVNRIPWPEPTTDVPVASGPLLDVGRGGVLDGVGPGPGKPPEESGVGNPSELLGKVTLPLTDGLVGGGEEACITCW